MKYTEKILLDNYDGLTNGMNNISVVDGKRILWNYRKGRDTDGYDPVVSFRKDAEEITLEYDRWASIELDESCKNHPALERIRKDLDELFDINENSTKQY